MDIDVDNEVHTRVADVSTAHAMCDDVAQSSDMDLGDEAHARTSDADGATAAATSDADTGINADTDPSPVVFAPPTAECIYLPSFYTYAGGLLTTPLPPPLMWMGISPTAPRRLPLPPPTVVWVVPQALRLLKPV